MQSNPFPGFFADLANVKFFLHNIFHIRSEYKRELVDLSSGALKEHMDILMEES